MNELAVIEQTDIAIRRAPAIVLEEAQKAARALTDVVSKKKKPVMFGGEQYLEFEDWQTVGRFYGVTAKVVSTQYIEFGQTRGYEARAVALRADGMEISSAESMCLNDERNWKGKDLFQIRSMAQTRACSKVLRNVLAWVVVLAGYRSTPAEELPQETNGKHAEVPPTAAEKPQDAPKASGKATGKGKDELGPKAKGLFKLVADTALPNRGRGPMTQEQKDKIKLFLHSLTGGMYESVFAMTEDEAGLYLESLTERLNQTDEPEAEEPPAEVTEQTDF